ncbi:MFS transporter [Pararhizobium sp. YC-54]|uniref:MFS transporter n=1 Tax=Pararhizobium sp. YC-54 TaxID=2986920 RepID=UPI0021F6B3A3|nr:MFS transporter [Pararhizobium sp. YC-54]MCW0001650.1 MFS transporter [Pararhizobium sp. YC-54]
MTTMDRPLSPSLAPTAFAGAVAMAVAMGFGRFSYTPILPGMMTGLGLSPADAGLIASANFVGYLAGAVAAGYGWAAGRERLISLSALAATTLLLLAMGLTSSLLLFSVIRFLAGVASAFTMIFTSAIVLSRGLAAGNPHVQSVHFGGVGIGIAVSSLMVFLLPSGGFGTFAGWQAAWFGGAIIACLGTVAAAALLPSSPAGGKSTEREKPLIWTRPLFVVTLTYGLFGFGYVITATFLVAMARQGATDHTVEFLAWLITGLAAAVSVHLWRAAVPRLGIVGVYLAGLLVEAAGLILVVALPSPYAPVIGGLMLGLTFIMITAYGLQIGRALAPESPRKALAFMTAAFGVGQIVGPLVAGWLAQGSGSFNGPTLLAAGVLLFCAVLIGVEMRRIVAAAVA